MAGVPRQHACMPPEWAPHARTWMSFPTGAYAGSEMETSARCWAAVANTIARYEPVTMLSDPSTASTARRLLDSAIDLVEWPINDSWMRDAGPTFVLDPDGELAAVTWTFNGWGAQDWARWDLDAKVGSEVAQMAGATPHSSALVNEGGGFHVNGGGTVLLTETVQRDPHRNGTLTRLEIEAEIGRQIGVDTFIWLERGLTADYERYGTRGHVDLVAAFTAIDACVVHTQPEEGHPDHPLSQQCAALLRANGLQVMPINAPARTHVEGRLVDWSYVNFYVGNGFALMPTFGEPDREAAARDVLAGKFPGRTVEVVDGRPLFELGGGVHCITQQQPASGRP